MNIKAEFKISHEQALAMDWAVYKILTADGPCSVSGETLLKLVRRELDIHSSDSEKVQKMSESERQSLLKSLKNLHFKEAILHTLLVPVTADGQVSLNKEKAFFEIISIAEFRTHWTQLVPAMRQNQVFPIKKELFKRSPDASRIMQRTWKEEGLRGIGNMILFMLGLYRNPALAQKFRDLEKLDEDTLGKIFFKTMRSKNLAFPGEKGGFPERMNHHDLLHVLTGYDTDAGGECQLAGFYAGFATGDAFTFIFTALSTFQLGLRVSPGPVTPAINSFDPEKVFHAFLRGRRLNVDVMGQWNYWALMPLKLEEARKALGI